VHIARLAANEGFVRLNLARELIHTAHAESVPDAVIHEPCRLLRDADGPVNFVGRYAVLAVHNLPHCHKPLCQRERGVLENGPSRGGELPVIVPGAALPPVVLLKERDVSRPATRAFNAIGPAARYEVFPAIGRDGKMLDRLLKGVEFRFP
jgi:hypothetical protein